MNTICIGRLALASFGLLLSACGGSGGGDDGSGGGPLEDDSPKFVSGRVIDETTGIPIEHALITTAPPTEVRLTDREGTYLLKDSVFEGTVFDVTARHVGYDIQTRTISVGADNTSGADFTLHTAVNGLVASVSTLQIPRDAGRSTFLLSSTLDDTPFSFQTTHPAFRVTPAQGTLSRNELIVIEVRFAPAAGQDDRVAGQLVANAENGGTGVTLNAIGNVPPLEVRSEIDPYAVLIEDDGGLVSGISGDQNGFLRDESGDVDVDVDVDDGVDGGANGVAGAGATDCGDGRGGPPEDASVMLGERLANELDSVTATDIYGFSASGGDEVFVPFARAPGSSAFFRLKVELRDCDGAVLETVSSASGVLSATLPADGRYFLWFSSGNANVAGAYEFTLQRTANPGDARSIEYGDTVQDVIDGVADLDVFVFEAQAGDSLVVPFARIPGSSAFFNLQVELRDFTGELLGSATGASGVFEGTTLRGGTHHLWLRNPRFNTPGDYEFTLRLAN